MPRTRRALHGRRCPQPSSLGVSQGWASSQLTVVAVFQSSRHKSVRVLAVNGKRAVVRPESYTRQDTRKEHRGQLRVLSCSRLFSFSHEMFALAPQRIWFRVGLTQLANYRKLPTRREPLLTPLNLAPLFEAPTFLHVAGHFRKTVSSAAATCKKSGASNSR